MEQERICGAVCRVGEKDRSREPWRTRTLRLTPQFACLASGDIAGDAESRQPGQTATFTVPASVRTLHLSAASGRRESDAKLRPTLAGASLQELNIDLDAWDAAVVRIPTEACAVHSVTSPLLGPRTSSCTVPAAHLCGDSCLPASRSAQVHLANTSLSATADAVTTHLGRGAARQVRAGPAPDASHVRVRRVERRAPPAGMLWTPNLCRR